MHRNNSVKYHVHTKQQILKDTVILRDVVQKRLPPPTLIRSLPDKFQG